MIDQASLQLALGQEDHDLDVNSFVQLLNETTNSYKYLFLLSLLKRIGQTPPNLPISIPLIDMALDMATLAWYPCRYFKLSFGSQDQLPQLLFNVGNSVSTRKHGAEVLKHIRREIHKHTDINNLATTLLRYVPFRLMRPFFNSELRGTPDGQVDRLVAELTRDAEHTTNPALYALHGKSNRPDDLTLHLNPRWQALIVRWHSVIQSWLLHEWAKYLQARNPTMPNILGKLLPPDQREQTQFQRRRKFWINLLEHQQVTCAYTSEKINLKNFELDHFLPWSFVGHDLPWNLIPSTASVNSSKGAKLPDEQYIDALASRQHLALSYAHKHMTDKKWSELTESYCHDLRLDQKSLLNPTLLSTAYQQTMKPQISLGKQLGFSGGWTSLVH
jgi:hypothetical protein